jgi:hypothetical protein
VATDTFDTILSEARKLRLNLVLCHQYLGQVSDRMRQSVIGNAGTLIVFRIGAEDSPLPARELRTFRRGSSAQTPCWSRSPAQSPPEARSRPS